MNTQSEALMNAPITDKMMEDFDTITECIKHVDNNNFAQIQGAVHSFKRHYPEFSSNADELQRMLDTAAAAELYLQFGGKYETVTA